MKTLQTILIVLAAALHLATPPAAGESYKPFPLLSPIECPSLLPAEEPYNEEDLAHCHYELLPPAFTAKLRIACRNCAAVEFSIGEYVYGADAVSLVPQTITLKRGTGEPQVAQLEKLLRLLSVQNRWYARIWEEGYEVELGATASVHFLAADGNELMLVELYPGGEAHLPWGEEYISLWELCRRCLPAPGSDPAACAMRPADSPPNAPREPYMSPYGMKLPDKPTYVDAHDHLFCYVRMSDEENTRLRRALADCAELRLELWVDWVEHPGMQKLRLTRSEANGLDARLRELAAVPQWLDDFLYEDAEVEADIFCEMELLDAEGKLLWQGSPRNVFHQPTPGARPVSLFTELKPYLQSEL